MSYTEREELLIALREFMVSGSASGVEYEAAEALASLLTGQEAEHG